jgi:hypothetical protein
VRSCVVCGVQVAIASLET